MMLPALPSEQRFTQNLTCFKEVRCQIACEVLGMRTQNCELGCWQFILCACVPTARGTLPRRVVILCAMYEVCAAVWGWLCKILTDYEYHKVAAPCCIAA
eukprot:4845613-Amphidinium_carterae.1